MLATAAAAVVAITGVTAEGVVRYDEVPFEIRPGVMSKRVVNKQPATVTAVCPAGAGAVSAGFSPYQPNTFFPTTVNGRQAWRAVFTEARRDPVKVKVVCVRVRGGGATSSVKVKRVAVTVPHVDYKTEVGATCAAGSVPTGIGWRHATELLVGRTGVEIKRRRASAEFFAPDAWNPKIEVFVTCLRAKGIARAGIVFAGRRIVLGVADPPKRHDTGTGRCRRGTHAFGLPYFGVQKGAEAQQGYLLEPHAIRWWTLPKGGEVRILPVHRPRAEFNERAHVLFLSQPCLAVSGARVTTKGL